MVRAIAFQLSAKQPIRSRADYQAAIDAADGPIGGLEVALGLYHDIVRYSDPKPKIEHPFVDAVRNIMRGHKKTPEAQQLAARLRVAREAFHVNLAVVAEEAGKTPAEFQTDLNYALFLGAVSKKHAPKTDDQGAVIGTIEIHEDVLAFANLALDRGLEYMANVIEPTLEQAEQSEQTTDYASSLARLRTNIPGMNDFHVGNGKKAIIDGQKQKIRGLIANFSTGNNGEKLATKIRMGEADTIIFLVQEHLKGNKEATAALLRLNRIHFDIHQNAKLEKRGLTLPSMDFIVNSADQNGSRMKYSDYEAVKGRLSKRRSEDFRSRLRNQRSEDFIIKSYNQAERASNSPNRLHQMALAGNTYAMEFLVVSAILGLNEESLSILVQLAKNPKDNYTKHRAREVIEKFVSTA